MEPGDLLTSTQTGTSGQVRISAAFLRLLLDIKHSDATKGNLVATFGIELLLKQTAAQRFKSQFLLLLQSWRFLMSSPSVTAFNRAVPLSWILLLALLIHGPLLLMQIPNDSYDAHLHQFFAAHYAHHWFSPWNEKWFTGFSQTTYPPL